ncbi:DUF72 domain-containing protein [Furfurilactobacillus siliginis]|uniref:DUF72 domain-containing protein n=1 Tax=Furfurilactobacillus siliginis TaxID=348151 RepID=A0A0R2L2H3_9LACO|nr:DUF72 domain-containing protein [Furfurilactobacillus siliginis]KRN95993.1 hypothetical protein IV55_GL001666 [Furfurilactobacillus siliginis]GEK28848.1 hypothetical protein LSI01_11590 [Furfurilactobacillus siliginis]
MITIGLSTWTRHPHLIHDEDRPVRFDEYAGTFPLVELDNPFYGVPTVKAVTNWTTQAPDGFKYILKAHQSMTRHDDGHGEPITDDVRWQTFAQFRRAVAPLVKAEKLATILFQFPPYFTRSVEHIQYLRDVRLRMGDLPVAVEFRDPSWYAEGVWSDVQDYLKSLQITYVIADEPFDGNQGVPFMPIMTTPTTAYFRLHGQNKKGWLSREGSWQVERTNYHYTMAEIQRLARSVQQVAETVDHVYVIFNNNGHGDAAENAEQLRDELGLKFTGLGPTQLDLF